MADAAKPYPTAEYSTHADMQRLSDLVDKRSDKTDQKIDRLVDIVTGVDKRLVRVEVIVAIIVAVSMATCTVVVLPVARDAVVRSMPTARPTP